MQKTKTLLCAVLLICVMLSACSSESKPEVDAKAEDINAEEVTAEEVKAEGQTKPQKETEPVTVVLPIDLNAVQNITANALPDLHYWSGRTVGYADEPTINGTEAHYFEYGCKSSELKAIFLEYLDALQENGFTQVGYYNKYGGESWGFLLEFAGDDVRTVGQMFTDTPCHFTVYNDDGVMKFIVSKDLTVCDTGLRRDGSTDALVPQGPSAGAGLIRLPDGSYQTSDGRLSAAIGTAMVLRDGTPYTATAEYADDKINIEGYYRNESIFFRAQADYLMEGDILTQREMRQWRQFTKEKGSQDTYKYQTVADISTTNNGEWISPTYESLKYAQMDVCTARVMYMDKGGDAVYYFYARFFGGEPKEIEALCAVSTADETGAFGKATYIETGDSVTLNYPHREYGSDYHTFDWEIVEGDERVALDAVGDTCTLTALKPGTAVVRVNYGYNTVQPDVLTGIPRSASRHKSETYYFVID